MSHTRLLLLVVGIVAVLHGGGWAMDNADIPATEARDAVMAGAEELQAFGDWVESAFTGKTSSARIPIEVRRQDFNTLHFGQSCMDTPITLADQVFEHGLGTHANSEIVVTLPQGAKQFHAFAGVDNNFDTQRSRGSVEFSVELDGKEVHRSPVLRCGDAPYPVDVEIPDGARQLTLKVGTTADGPGWDQSDWADALLVMADGSKLYLDEGRRNEILARDAVPFSFVYGDAASSKLLKDWKREVEQENGKDGRVHRLHWTDPVTGLKVTAEAKSFSDYPAADWVLYFENTGTKDTSILEDVQALDVQLLMGNSKRVGTLYQINGDVCNETSFKPAYTVLGSDQEVKFAPNGGRSSNGTFSFFDVEHADRGVIVGIGWSGQWAASINRSAAGPARLRSGMERTHLVLHPGERIRTPRTLLMSYQGDRTDAHNRFRRLMLFHYMPKFEGRPTPLPVVLQCFDRYSWTHPEWATEAGQIEAVEFAHDAGFDSHWLDAAWFEGGFPDGVGNWFCKPKAFPNGLKPIADACHERGMKFVVWFEPERVGKKSQVVAEHPEFVHGGADGGLYKLDDPAAFRWIADLLSKRIDEFGIDVYRQDFNMDPLDYWRRNDAPDRQGMTEIRYVEGLYALWDELLAKHPGLLIDNCSSGGRRIDLETCMRAVPFWRSDTNCTPGHADWNQSHTTGLCQYVPLNMACAWTPDAYTVRSAAMAGLIGQWAYLEPDFPMDLAKASLAEAKENRKYWYGDVYPLVAAGPAPDQWWVYQVHRADLDEGMVLVFRRPESSYTSVGLSLRGLVADRTYTVEMSDDARTRTTKTATGKELGEGWEVRLPDKGKSVIVRYKGATP